MAHLDAQAFLERVDEVPREEEVAAEVAPAAERRQEVVVAVVERVHEDVVAVQAV